MERGRLILLCGIPGSGKSTWACKHITGDDVYVSRDEIRYSIIKNDEEYFSHEDEVFNLFIRKIESGLKEGKCVYADATHINWASRSKVLNSIHNIEDYDVDVYFFKTDVKTCLERNAQRIGRARVPDDAINRMAGRLHHPRYDPFEYHQIKTIRTDGR